MTSDTWKKCGLWALGIYCLFSFVGLFFYYTDEYIPFVKVHPSLSTYLDSGLRMVCRLGYPVAAIGIVLRQRWGAWLLLIAWLLQLIPSSVYFLSTTGNLGPGGWYSLITFILSMAILYVCRSALRNARIVKPLLFFFACAVVMHTALYFIANMHESGTAVTAPKPANAQGYQLLEAVRRGDVSAVRNLLAAGADPNSSTSLGDTALIVALMNERWDALDVLLKHKADVNQTNRLGASAFTGECMMGNAKIVDKLLSYGADVNKTFPFMNPLTHKVQENTSPLSAAVQLNHHDVVTLLLQHQADPSIKDSLGKSAEDYARENPKIGTLRN